MTSEDPIYRPGSPPLSTNLRTYTLLCRMTFLKPRGSPAQRQANSHPALRLSQDNPCSGSHRLHNNLAIYKRQTMAAIRAASKEAPLGSPLYLGLDFGTSGARAAVIDGGCNAHGEAHMGQGGGGLHETTCTPRPLGRVVPWVLAWSMPVEAQINIGRMVSHAAPPVGLAAVPSRPWGCFTTCGAWEYVSNTEHLHLPPHALERAPSNYVELLPLPAPFLRVQTGAGWSKTSRWGTGRALQPTGRAHGRGMGAVLVPTMR